MNIKGLYYAIYQLSYSLGYKIKIKTQTAKHFLNIP